MSLKCETPCDYGNCPYEVTYNCDCEYFCGAKEPEDYPEENLDTDFNPLMGGYYQTHKVTITVKEREEKEND